MSPFKAVESDKRPYCREWGFVYALATAVISFPAMGLESLMLPWVVLFAIIGYFGGVLTGWFFWGLFFEPQVEARKRGQGAV